MTILGGALWIAVTDRLSVRDLSEEQHTAPVNLTVETTDNSQPAGLAVQASPSPEPPTSAAVAAPAPPVKGLHVIYPLEGGRSAHLLLTAETYYEAVTPEEEAMLTERLGPPVTNVNPNLLPPRSPISVTDALGNYTS